MNEQLECTIVSLDNVEQMKDIWENPAVKVLFSALKLVPPLETVINSTISELFKKAQEKKQRELCELIFSDNTITLGDVQNVTFITEFAKVLDVVNRLSTNHKIKYIAKLFKNSYTEFESLEGISEFEEYLHKLSNISYREIDLLFLLDRVENKVNNSRERSAEKIYAAWNEFKKEAKKRFNLQEETVLAIMSGLAVTGFCREARFMFPSKGMIETPVYTTTYFDRFLKLIQ